jgi:hypothetical protein
MQDLDLEFLRRHSFAYAMNQSNNDELVAKLYEKYYIKLVIDLGETDLRFVPNHSKVFFDWLKCQR